MCLTDENIRFQAEAYLSFRKLRGSGQFNFWARGKDFLPKDIKRIKAEVEKILN